MASRGQHLVRADRRFATGGGLLGKLVAPAYARIVDQIDRRLVIGGIEVVAPGGAARRLGFRADGPVAIVRLDNWMAVVRLALSGSVGWYKAWEMGEWSSPDPVKVFEIFSANARSLGDTGRAKGLFRLVNALAHRLRDNAPRTARKNIAAHYDLGNDFYSAWLDESMTYSSALFSPHPFVLSEAQSAKSKGAGTAVSEAPFDFAQDERGVASLESAQHHKIATLLNRLELKPGQRLLEIGCGWGSLAIAAARRGVSVVGLTLSLEQKHWAEQKIAEAGLSDRIEIRLQDYRQTDDAFDAVASIEMVEAVGERWWGTYLDCIARNLKPGGRAALQYISIDHALFDAYRRSADFIQTYIFPGGMLVDEPSFADLARQRGLSWDDRDGFGQDYAKTLHMWRARFDQAALRGDLKDFDAAFQRLWRYYLMYCEGGFRGRAIDVAQITMIKA